MLVIFSHVLAFSTLFIASVWDLYTTDVPDFTGIIGVGGGITLHAVHSYMTGSVDPLVWSLGVGMAFSIYGWGMYLLGMWGGADAFSMSVLGFAAPYGLSGTGLLHSANLFVNIMLLGIVYSIVFAVYKAFRTEDVSRQVIQSLREQEKRVAAEVLFAGLFSAAATWIGLNGLLYFGAFLALIFLTRFFRVLENEAMTEKVEASELEPGDVVDGSILPGSSARNENFFGRSIGRVEKLLPFQSAMLERLENRVGYPEVVGVTEDEIEKLREENVDKVEVKGGLRFVPVFPLALVLTDTLGGGLLLLTFL